MFHLSECLDTTRQAEALPFWTSKRTHLTMSFGVPPPVKRAPLGRLTSNRSTISLKKQTGKEAPAAKVATKRKANGADIGKPAAKKASTTRNT